ncbi:MAG: hypothetical protein AVDCRST_MAG68-87 [uncultured Gemmatimonadetes bacterium]|uniref:VCBS repeat-containing protein n=1 Tax=uncultured Gemmatimonadota bacterium TaxID=203437 RepID=A0A6J4K6H5_9BACT|nr:MAG: hypothetical protein AVDCRST_MAG68-87 [uncultured Gemmatimonadota bacterium]
MKRHHVAAAVAVGAVLLVAASRPVRAQDWRPPAGSPMPAMPAPGDVNEAWVGRQARWLAGGPAGISARPEGVAAGKARFVRFNGQDMRMAGAWSDRNGDGVCDMVEVYNGDGALTAQLLDPAYSGKPSVLRVYADGKLVREERL